MKEEYRTRGLVTREHLLETHVSAPGYSRGADGRVLVRYRNELQNLTQDAFEFFGKLLTNDDPEGFRFLEEAKRRKCHCVAVRSSRVQILLAFLRNEIAVSQHVVDEWNKLTQLHVLEESGFTSDFDMQPFAPYLQQFKAQYG